MGNVTTTDITDFEGLSAVNNINSNTHKLRDEFDKVIYKDGREEMTGPLDMNNQRIYNLPDASARTDAMNYGQFLDAISSSGVFASLIAAALSLQKTEITATSGQTVFTPTSGYIVGFVNVYVNGIRLASADYTASNGTTVTLATGATLNDIVTIESFKGSAVMPVSWSTGNGSPESVVIAPVGSIYSRLDGGASTVLYVKESGTGNTGWVAK